MMLSKERLLREIKASYDSIKKLRQIEQDSISGIEVNEIVLAAFKRELSKLHRNIK